MRGGKQPGAGSNPRTKKETTMTLTIPQQKVLGSMKSAILSTPDVASNIDPIGEEKLPAEK